MLVIFKQFMRKFGCFILFLHYIENGLSVITHQKKKGKRKGEGDIFELERFDLSLTMCRQQSIILKNEVLNISTLPFLSICAFHSSWMK